MHFNSAHAKHIQEIEYVFMCVFYIIAQFGTSEVSWMHY